jgi:hypothetical protein
LFAQENSNLTQSPLFFMAIFSPTLLHGLNASIAERSVAIEAINVASDGAIEAMAI